ncbi:MAG: hypothetical protein IKL07_10825 [Clostridium sp.]|mgnify:CR=1 FL=1|nr:hypothetical protein [Clostridium sp.]
MKVAFWSNSSGRAGTTSNMACISVICSLLNKKSILFENHYSLNGLDQALVNRKKSPVALLREEFSFYDPIGIDALLRRIHSNHTYEQLMEDISMKFLDDKLYYLPKNVNLNQEYFEYELNQVIKPLMEYLDKRFDLVFIDTAANDVLSTKTILEEADLVVANLCQNKAVLEHFFTNYASIIDKSVILIGNYQEQSRFHLRNIRRRYQITKEQVGMIPFNMEFADAASSGRLVEFLVRNFSCQKQDENYSFIYQAKRAANMILAQLEDREVCVESGC